MSAKDLKSLSKQELQGKLAELQKEQLKIKIARSTGQSEKTHLLKAVRKNIARVKTFMNEQVEK